MSSKCGLVYLNDVTPQLAPHCIECNMFYVCFSHAEGCCSDTVSIHCIVSLNCMHIYLASMCVCYCLFNEAVTKGPVMKQNPNTSRMCISYLCVVCIMFKS